MSFRNVEIEKQINLTDSNGVQCTYKALLHNEKGPSVVKPNGDQWWYLNGKLHRGEGKPAYISHDGRTAYFVHGKKPKHS